MFFSTKPEKSKSHSREAGLSTDKYAIMLQVDTIAKTCGLQMINKLEYASVHKKIFICIYDF